MNKFDLHCHSTYSDGVCSPELLVEKALAVELQYLALTDHDTIAGVSPLIEAARGTSLSIIPGVEISTRWKLADIHVVGLHIDIEHEGLQTFLAEQNRSRVVRAQTIGERLLKCGIQSAYEKACLLAGHSRAARPHFAKVMMQEGVVDSMEKAFKKYLGRGKPAYVPTPWASIPLAVKVIQEAKGMAVLAHPAKYRLTRTKLQELVSFFKTSGGEAIEVVSGSMMAYEIEHLATLARRYKLLASAGSDFHGDATSRTKLGGYQALPNDSIAIWSQWSDKER